MRTARTALRARKPLLLGLALVALGALAGPAAVTNAGADEKGLRLLGTLPTPPLERLSGGAGVIIQVDEQARRMYYLFFDPTDGFHGYIREYDLTRRVPTVLREVRAFPENELSSTAATSPYLSTIDTKRKRLLFVNFNHPVACDPPQVLCEGTLPAAYRVEIVDLATLRYSGHFNLHRSTPGFVPYGIRYSEEDDRLYMVGEMQAFGTAYNNNNQGIVPAAVTAAAAIEPEAGGLGWIKLVPQCQVPMATYSVGSVIARSRLQPALYFACVRTSVYPGESGVVRLWIDPAGDQQDALGFPVDFFAVSGQYESGDGIVGIAAFDPTTDRFFMQNRSFGTPGTWVLDGRYSSWVGFIAAPDSNDFYAALDPTTGHFYIASDTGADPGYILVADGSVTPVPQGAVFSLPGVIDSAIVGDPTSHRLFVSLVSEDGQSQDILVYEDAVPRATPPSELDYDSLTTDVAEGPKTTAAFSGDVNGFGSRVLLVGGLAGIRSRCMNDLSGAVCEDFFATPGLKMGPRGVIAGGVPSLDVRNVGASASAQALTPDPITQDEYVTRVQEPAAEQAGGATGDAETAEEVKRRLDWPHAPSSCLDGGDSKEGLTDDADGPGGSSKVACDLTAYEASAEAVFSGLALEGFSVAKSSFSAAIRRDPVLGTVTETEAAASGVHIEAPNGATVTIGRIVATATTAAHGRPGTASVRWERALSGVLVVDQAGAVVYRCGDEDTCNPAQAVAAMNQVLARSMRITLPEPEQDATGGGAFAGVRETDADYYNGLTVNDDDNRAVPSMEIVLYQDTAEKSRVVVQLAAIQASSIYGISPLPGDAPPPDGPPTILPSVGPLPSVLPTSYEPPVRGPIAGPPSGPVAQLVRSALFFIRSPKDALLLGLTALLFAAAAGSAVRRRSMLRRLQGD